MRHRSLPATAPSRRRPPPGASAERRPRARSAEHVGGARRRDLDRFAHVEQLERGGGRPGERPAGRRCLEAQLEPAHAPLGVDPHVDRLAVERGGHVGDGRAANLVAQAAPSALAAIAAIADDAHLCGGLGEAVERTQGGEKPRRGGGVDGAAGEGRPGDGHPVGGREPVGPRHRPELRIDHVVVDDHAVRRGEVAGRLIGGGAGLWLQGLRQPRHVGLGLGLPPPPVEGSAMDDLEGVFGGGAAGRVDGSRVEARDAGDQLDSPGLDLAGGLERKPQRVAVDGPAGDGMRGAIGPRLGRSLARRRGRAGGRLARIAACCHRHDHARRGDGPQRDLGDGEGEGDGEGDRTAHLGSSYTGRVTRRRCTTTPSRRQADAKPTPSGQPGAAALTLAGIVLSAVRWQKVLNALEIRTKLPRLVRHNLAGQFVSNVLPTTIGGDVLRVSRLSRDTGESSGTFASVVLERLTGWLVLPVITIVGFAVNPGLRHLGSATSVALALSLGTLALLLGVLAAAASSRIGGRFATRADWRRFAGAVHLGINRLRSHPCAAANVLMAGFAYQLALVLAAVAAAQALGPRPPGLTALLAFFPAVLIAQVLPISMSGLGVREGAFVLFLGPLGVAKEEAIALGLLLYLLNVAVSLLGAPAFAAGGRPRRTVAAT